MPTVHREGPYRFFFYSNDRSEPMHVHVERDGRVAKFWLEPVELQKRGGHREPDLSRIEKMGLISVSAHPQAVGIAHGSESELGFFEPLSIQIEKIEPTFSQQCVARVLGSAHYRIIFRLQSCVDDDFHMFFT